MGLKSGCGPGNPGDLCGIIKNRKGEKRDCVKRRAGLEEKKKKKKKKVVVS